MARPSATIVVPFRGSEPDMVALVRRFGAVRRLSGDEVLVADNSDPQLPHGQPDGVVVVPAAGIASPAHARNSGAARARGEWLVFCDADTEPSHDLLDAYFDPAPAERTGILAGAVEDDPEGGGLAGRLARATAAMSQRASLENGYMPYALTANCAVRRTAFEQAGGFEAGIRAGEDADLCWRLQRLGWQLEERPLALVRHRSRETMAALWRQRFLHGGGAAWLERRYPGSMPRWSAPALVRDSIQRLVAGFGRDRGEFGLALATVTSWWAFELGRLTSNRARGATTSRGL